MAKPEKLDVALAVYPHCLARATDPAVAAHVAISAAGAFVAAWEEAHPAKPKKA